MNRSGSTFLSNIFSSLDEIVACPEAEILVQEFLEAPMRAFNLTRDKKEYLENRIKTDLKLKTWRFSTKLFKYLENARTNFEAFFAFLKSFSEVVKPEAKIVVFKAERLIHFFHLPGFIEIQKVYSIQMLAVVRDIRGIYYSQVNTIIPESGKLMAKGVVHSALNWNKFVMAVERLQGTPDFMSMKFENLIGDFSLSMSRLAFFLGLKNTKFSADKGQLFGILNQGHREIHLNASRKPIISKIDEWQGSLSHSKICLIEFISKTELLHFNYKLCCEQVFSINLYVFSIIGKFYYQINKLLKKVGHKIKLSELSGH